MISNFPYSQFPSTDDRLNQIVQRHGGWITVLNPNLELTEIEDLLLDLKNAGYDKCELIAYKTLTSSDKRSKLLLQASVLHKKRHLGISSALDEASTIDLQPSLLEMAITDAEIVHASEFLAPHILKWSN